MLASLPNRAGAEIDRAVLIREYHEAVRACAWISADVWERAIRNLIRTERWFPAVVTLLRACADAEEALTRERSRTDVRDDLPTWLTTNDQAAIKPETLQPVIDRGEWDRTYAHATLIARRRRQYHVERVAHYRIALGPATARDKLAPICAAGRDLAGFDAWPLVSVCDVDDELRRMAAMPARTKGGLRGGLADALRFRLAHEQ
jgi:hypothetical protein